MTIKSIFRPVICAKGVRKITRKLAFPIIRKRIKTDISNINRSGFRGGKLSTIKRILYIRSDFWLKDSSPNGAVAHTEGIINALENQRYEVEIVSSFSLPYIKRYHSFQTSPPNGWLTGISELEEMEYNRQLFDFLKKNGFRPDVIYQRYGRNSYAGLMYARHIGVPFVLEYNGSEIWMARNWGHPLRYESLTEEIERCVLTHADLVIGNAEAFKKELLSKDVDENHILIVPNGVDPNRFNPSISGLKVRDSLGIKEDEFVVSFVGSFGPWHGSEILAETIPIVTTKNKRIKYLFVGDGVRLQNVKDIVSRNGTSGHVLFVGFINRDLISEYLAASDILVSPQVPNPDGTPFFGSPTKLFEYMAMGKAIIASDLDQIGRILISRENAILVPPGDVSELAEAILTLANDTCLCARLGRQARKIATERYSWDSHVQVILERISHN